MSRAQPSEKLAKQPALIRWLRSGVSRLVPKRHGKVRQGAIVLRTVGYAWSRCCRHFVGRQDSCGMPQDVAPQKCGAISRSRAREGRSPATLQAGPQASAQFRMEYLGETYVKLGALADARGVGAPPCTLDAARARDLDQGPGGERPDRRWRASPVGVSRARPLAVRVLSFLWDSGVVFRQLVRARRWRCGGVSGAVALPSVPPWPRGARPPLNECRTSRCSGKAFSGRYREAGRPWTCSSLSSRGHGG